MVFRSLNVLSILAALAIGVFAIGAPAHAGTISLAWDPVVHNDLSGYRLDYGTSQNNLNLSDSVGMATSATLSGLQDCTTYYVAVKAVSDDGQESPVYSNSISGWARPEVVPGAPQEIERGASGQIVISGTNFQSGATVNLSGSGLTIDNITVNNCSQIQLLVSASPSADLGPVDVEVINPDQVFGAGSGLFSVVADGTGPSISSVQTADVGSTTATIEWTTDEPATSQVFFRRGGESTYQETAIDSTMVTDHSVEITGLATTTAYEYYVSSRDGAGNTATAGGNPFTTADNNYTYLRIEAESTSVTAPLEGGFGAQAFDGEWVSLSNGAATGDPNDPTGSWEYGFNVPSAGNWTVWFRIYTPASSPGGWLEGMDGSGLDYVEPFETNRWEWVAGRSYNLDAGFHDVVLGGYTASARLDRILITDDPGFLPTEVPGADVAAPSAASSMVAAPADQRVDLSWNNPSDGDLARVVLCYRNDGRAPANPLDGWVLSDRAASPGDAESHVHNGLTNGLTYHYAVFAIDGAGNVASPATASAMPEPPPDPLGTVQNLHRTDVKGN